MRIYDAREVSKFLMSFGEVPLLVGPAGVGKTDIVKQIAQQTNRKLVILVLSQMEPGDLIGLPSKQDDRTVFLRPDWWPEDGNVIIFLDEINRAHGSIRNAIMQLLIDKRIHNHVLPEGTWIVAAMNPATEEYMVEEVFDKAFLDRFIILKVTPDFDSWRDYMIKKYSNSASATEYISVINEIVGQDPTIFMGEDFSLPEISPTPRNLERLFRILDNLPESLQHLAGEIAFGVSGKTGVLIASRFLQRKKLEMLSYKNLLGGDIEKVKNAAPQQRVAALDGLMSYLKNNNDVSEEEADNVAECLKLYRREELSPLFRIAGGAGDTLKKLKKGRKFREFFINFLKSLGDLGTILEKL